MKFRHPTRQQLTSLLRTHVFPLALLIFSLTAFRSAVADWQDVPTGSMNPTILEGDRVLVNNLAFGLRVPFTNTFLTTWSSPTRGDIVTFRSPHDGARMVKRVIAVPGDTVELRNDVLYINGTRATYTPAPAQLNDLPAATKRLAPLPFTEWVGPASRHVLITPSIQARRTFGPITIPPGKYLMLGDNRDNSLDSRYWGLVDAAHLYGRVPAVAFSLNHDSYHLPRPNRFLKPLK